VKLIGQLVGGEDQRRQWRRRLGAGAREGAGCFYKRLEASVDDEA
jgi:hypothetical protein